MAPIDGSGNKSPYYNFTESLCEDLTKSGDVIPDKDPELLQSSDFVMPDDVTVRSEATWQSKLFRDPSDHLQLPKFTNETEKAEFLLSLQLMALGQVYQEAGFDKMDSIYQKVGGFTLLAENPKRLDLISEMVETSFKLYENNPSEANLHKVFYVLKQFNLDPKYLKDRIAWNKRMIAESKSFDPKAEKAKLQKELFGVKEEWNPAYVFENPYAQESKSENIFTDAINHPQGIDGEIERKRIALEEQASLAEAELPILEGLLEQISGDLSTLVSKSNAKDPVEALAHKSTVELLSGDRNAAIISLKELRSLVQKNPPKDQKEIAEYVTYLHRLVDLQKDVDLSQVDHSALKEAKTYLAQLPKNNLVKVSLTLENLELKDAVHQRQLAADLQAEKITQSEYAGQINKVREEIQAYSHMILESKDLPEETKAYVLESALKNAGRIYDNTLNMALIFHQSEEADKAGEYVKLAEATHTMEVSQLSNLGLAKQDPSIRNSLARKDLSLAHYKFRTGKIEESIQFLQEIVTEYPESEVTGIILSKSYWPAQFGIVKDGQFTEKLSDPSYVEGIKTTAAKFNEKKGRAFMACGLGAATYIVADIALGEKATGLGLAVACGSAFLIERGFLVTENAHEIVESYEYAVSRHSTEEALKGAGGFALDMGLLFLGGAAGSVAKTAYMTQMSRLAPRFAEALVSVGIKPGPWTRQAGAFLLEESGNVVMSSVMHATTLEGTRAVYALQGEEIQVKHKAEDYLKTWIMIRLFMGVNQSSPANGIIKDIHATTLRGRAAGLSGNELNQFVLERISLTDKAAAFGINTTIASTLTQLSYSLAENDFDKFSDKVTHLSVEMLVIHLGQKPFHGLSAKQAEVMKVYFVEAEANYARARKIIEEAPDHNNNGPWNSGPQFAFAGANNASPESEKTKDPKQEGILLMSEGNMSGTSSGERDISHILSDLRGVIFEVNEANFDKIIALMKEASTFSDMSLVLDYVRSHFLNSWPEKYLNRIPESHRDLIKRALAPSSEELEQFRSEHETALRNIVGTDESLMNEFVYELTTIQKNYPELYEREINVEIFMNQLRNLEQGESSVKRQRRVVGYYRRLIFRENFHPDQTTNQVEKIRRGILLAGINHLIDLLGQIVGAGEAPILLENMNWSSRLTPNTDFAFLAREGYFRYTRVADLSYNNISQAQLIDILLHFNTVEELNLSFCFLDAQAYTMISVGLLSGNMPHLQRLDLRGNLLPTGLYGEVLTAMISDAARVRGIELVF